MPGLPATIREKRTRSWLDRHALSTRWSATVPRERGWHARRATVTSRLRDPRATGGEGAFAARCVRGDTCNRVTRRCRSSLSSARARGSISA